MRKVEKPYHEVTHRSAQHRRLSESIRSLCGFVSYQPRKRREDSKLRFLEELEKLEKVLDKRRKDCRCNNRFEPVNDGILKSPLNRNDSSDFLCYCTQWMRLSERIEALVTQQATESGELYCVLLFGYFDNLLLQMLIKYGIIRLIVYANMLLLFACAHKEGS